MKRAKLLHNISAGEEDHEAEVLLNQIKQQGFDCTYSSTKKEALRKLESGFDFLVAAGGDGTIRKITRSLLKRKKLEKPWTIALLPLGTANNISKSLELTEKLNHSSRHGIIPH
jgi:diacylglycerol kinase family enzyme